MSETKKETKNETAPNPKVIDERVDLFIPKGNINDEPNILISINGVNYLLPKGKTSRVPQFVKYEYDRSQRAQALRDEEIDRLVELASKQQ